MNYYVKRTAQAVFTMYVAVTASFALYRSMPGGPETHIRNQLYQKFPNLPADQIEARVDQYLLVREEKPLLEAYLDYLYDIIVQLDFGQSIIVAPGQEVLALIMADMPWTVFVSVQSMTYGIISGIIFGSVMAYYESERPDTGLTFVSIVLDGIPFFVAGIFFIFLFGYELQWLPVAGSVAGGLTPGFNVDYITSVIRHSILPIGTGMLLGIGGSSLSMRANAISVLGEDYLRVARLRGLPPFRITQRYVMRNAILPMYTGIMIGLAAIFSGSVIFEQIFAYQGVGKLMFTAVIARDYPLMMGTFILLTGLTVLGLLLADLTYGLIDPRIAGSDSDV